MSSSIPSSAGVYKITCVANGLIYIGSSCNLHKRKNDHSAHLIAQRHANTHLQRAWNKYGAESFRFDVIEQVADVVFLLEREQYYLDTLRPYDRSIGFNLCRDADSPRNPPVETRKKMSESAKRRGPPVAATSRAAEVNKGRKKRDETRERMSNSAKNRAPEHLQKIKDALKGRVFSEETRRKMSEAAKARPRDPEIIRRLAERNRGSKRSEETRRKMSEANYRRHAK